MSPTDDTLSDRRDEPTTDERTDPEDESMVIFEFTVPTEAFILEKALREHPDVIAESERLVPTNNGPSPYLWTTDGKTPEFEDAMGANSEVERVEKVAVFDEGALYRIEWASTDSSLLRWLTESANDSAILQAEGHGGEWTLKLRFPSRSVLTDFREFCDERGIGLRVVRLYDLVDPKLGQYNITAKQREALVRALEMGHFEIPREATLEDVATSLDISPRAVSERLRRGQTNLVNNSLTIGQPTGVGLGEQ